MKLPDFVHILRDEAERLRARMQADASQMALSQLLRPNLGTTPAPLRRWLEPVVALAAVSVLVSLLAIGALSFVTLSVVAALIYAILTHVFGLSFSVAA